MATRWQRVARGVSAATLATFAAAFSHGAADGAHPPLFAIALAMAFATLACVAMAGRRMTRARLSASVLVSQLLYHCLFAFFGPASRSVIGRGQAHRHHPDAVFDITPIGSAADALDGASASGMLMLLAHVLAAVMTILALRQGEAAARTVLRCAVTPFVRLMSRLHGLVRFHATSPTTGRHTLARNARRLLPRRIRIPTASLSRRGPPAAAFA